jgi:Tfp pilus assembly protein PilF
MARSIAAAMHATLSPSEEEAIEQQLTDNLEALEAYRRAKILSRYFFADELKRAEAEIKHALELDPSFALAWAQLAYINMAQYWGVSPRDEYRVQALEAIEKGREIDPDLTDLDIMEGYYHYWGFLDYTAALEILEPLLPDNRNNAELLQVTAFVNRRAGNWNKALQLLHQAEGLAPRELRLTYTIGETYATLRQWDQAQAYLDKTAALGPAHSRTLQLKGDIIAGRDGDFATGARYIGLAREHQRFLRLQYWDMLLLAGDYEGALEAAAIMDDELEPEGRHFLGLTAGITHAYFGNPNAAAPLLQTARNNLEVAFDEEINDFWRLRALCESNAALGLQDQAIAFCARARETMPVDAMDIPLHSFDIGAMLAMAGAKDAAMAMLMPVAESGIGYSKHWYLADQRLDTLRDHPDWPALMDALESDL